MKKFLDLRYASDLIAAAFTMLLLFSPYVPYESSLHSLAIGIGILMGFLPRVLSGAENRSIESEKKRSLILFCVYLFLTLWLTDFERSEGVVIISRVLSAAAIYHVSFYGVVTYFEDRKQRQPISEGFKRLGYLVLPLAMAYFLYQLFIEPPFSSKWIVDAIFLSIGIVGIFKKTVSRRMQKA